MDTLHIPSQVRSALYLILMLGAPVVAYLQIENIIGANEVALWAGLSSVIALIARLNLTKD